MISPFSDTIDTLIYLKSQGYRLAVISNGITIKQWEKLVRLGVYPFFDDVVTSEAVGVAKPDAEIFNIAMERLGVTAGTSMMVGNKFDVDILGACNAGMQSMLINSTLTDNQKELLEEMGCTHSVREITSLIDLMKIL